MTVIEKISYLKGLADGLGLDPENKQDKLIKAIIDVLDDVSLSISDLEDTYAELSEQVDAVDEDLAMLEDDYFGDYEDDDDDMDDEEYYEVECPQCGDHIYLDEDLLEEGNMDCPNCGAELEFDVSDECGDECECECDHEPEE